MLTETVTLCSGFLIDGKRYKTAIVREPLVKDTLDAEVKADGRSPLFLTTHLFAGMVEQLGTVNEKDEWVETVPREKITADSVAMLSEVDYDRLGEVRDILKKKANWQRNK